MRLTDLCLNRFFERTFVGISSWLGSVALEVVEGISLECLDFLGSFLGKVKGKV